MTSNVSSEVRETAGQLPPVREPSLTYAWYVVSVLMVCYTLSFIDRQILSLLVGPIKHDLQISDTRIGLLQGLAFALFYTTLGLPIGRLADSLSRRNIIVAGVFFWSLMTALCAVAKSFWSLFSARMGVGVGEATLSPSSFSLIADYFPRERLGTALSVYSMGVFVGSGLALIVGGQVVDAVTKLTSVTLPVIGSIAPWRLTFLLVGVPGILIALLVYTVREPMRRNLLRSASGHVSRLSIREVLHQMGIRWQSVAGISLALAFQSACNYSLLAWAPTFFIRVHHWTAGEAGLALGIIVLVMGCIGILAGGRLCDRWQGKGIHEAPLKVGAIGAIGAAILTPIAMSLPHASWTIAALTPALFFLSMPVGTSYASLQMIFPNQVRAQVSALFLLILSMGGLVLGPLAPGLFNDYLFKNPNMVGYSIALAIAIFAVSNGVLFRLTYRPYRRHYAMMRGDD